MLAELRWSSAQLADLVRSLPPEEMEWQLGRNGWKGRQILAHIASMERTYPLVIELARSGDRRIAVRVAAQFNVDPFNELQVAKRADRPISDLVAEFQQNRLNTIAAVESCEIELMEAHVDWAGGVSGALSEVLLHLAVEQVAENLAEIMGRGGWRTGQL